MIEQLIQNYKLEILRDAVGIIRDELLQLKSSMEKNMAKAYELFPTVDRLTVHDDLMTYAKTLYVNKFHRVLNQQFVLPIPEFVGENNSKQMDELAQNMASLLGEMEQCSIVLHKINHKIEDYALQESLKNANNSWCSFS